MEKDVKSKHCTYDSSIQQKPRGLEEPPPSMNSSRMKLDYAGLDSSHRTLYKVMTSEMLIDPKGGVLVIISFAITPVAHRSTRKSYLRPFSFSSSITGAMYDCRC